MVLNTVLPLDKLMVADAAKVKSIDAIAKKSVLNAQPKAKSTEKRVLFSSEAVGEGHPGKLVFV